MKAIAMARQIAGALEATHVARGRPSPFETRQPEGSNRLTRHGLSRRSTPTSRCSDVGQQATSSRCSVRLQPDITR